MAPQNKKADPDHADEAPARSRKAASRADGAIALGGIWYGADGVPLAAVDAQQAQRAADAEAFAAREAALSARDAQRVAKG